MNLSSVLTTYYENISNWTIGQNKPNSNPIKPNSQKAQMNVNLTLTTDYRKNVCLAVQKNKSNSNPKQTQSKPVLSAVEWANFRKNECKLLCYSVL